MSRAGAAAFELLDELAPILASTAYGVVIEGVASLIATFGRKSDGLANFLSALSALARSAGRNIGFSALAGRAPAARRGAVRSLLTGFARLAADGCEVPRLYMSWRELDAALGDDATERAPAELLLARGILVPVWSTQGGATTSGGAGPRWGRSRLPPRAARADGAGLRGRGRRQPPALARRAGAWREDLLLEAVAQTIEASVDGLECLGAFQKGSSRAREEHLRERTAYTVTPVGLREALRILGDGEERVEQGARLLGLLSEAVRRFSQPRGLDVVLSPFFGARARRRMAALDRGAAPPRASQPRSSNVASTSGGTARFCPGSASTRRSPRP